MKSFASGLKIVLTAVVLAATSTPSLAGIAGVALSPSALDQDIFDRLSSVKSGFKNVSDLSQFTYQAGLEAVKDCDEARLKAALDQLRTFVEDIQGDKISISEIRAANAPDSPIYPELLSAADQLLSSLQSEIKLLTNTWEAAKQECAKKQNSSLGTAVTPGSDVAKGHVVFVDPKTQQPIPGGQVVIIPKDPEKPKTVVEVPPTGTVEIPSHGPDDTIWFYPVCHQKVSATGNEVDGNKGVQVATASHALTFIADVPCSEVGYELIDSYLGGQGMRVADCSSGKWAPGDFSRGSGRPGDPWEVREEQWGIFPPKYKCIITVHCYERSSRAVAENACAVPIPTKTTTVIPTDTRTGKPPDGKTTTTITIEDDQPREIQGPPPSERYAKSKGSWGQAYPDQWALRAINWLRADGTTVLPKQGTPVIVAVIDTGVDMSHPDILGAAWLNTEVVAKGPGERSAKGYYGDYFGWNFIDGNGDISDKNGHGTVIAGIIAAGVGKGFGIAGINPWARIMPLKIMEINGKGGSINLGRAVVYAVDHGARVINLSVGGERLTVTEQAALDYAAEQGVVVVVASGNQGINTANFSPAGLRNALTVAALGPDLKRPTFSNWGSTISIAAPGVDILSLRARQTDLLIFDKPGYKAGTAVVGERYYRVTGSSFAAPMVSGAASLLFSARPELTGEQVKRMLVQSARNLSGVGKDQFTGYGVLDIEAALAADPEFFVEAEISGVEVVQEAGKTLVRVKGTATANKFKDAWVEVGKGESPTEWKKVSKTINKAVSRAVIDDLDPGIFREEKVWIVRVVVEHENGRRREGWFRLQIG